MEYLFHILITFCIFYILCSSLNIVLGLAGLFSLAHGLAYGFGAYAFAIISPDTTLEWLLSLFASPIIGGLTFYLIWLMSSKIRGDGFVIITLSVQIIGYSILLNWTELTNGPFGIGNIPRPNLLPTTISSSLSIVTVAVLSACLAYVVSRRLEASLYGISLRGIRDNELSAIALGIPNRKNLRQALVLSGILAGSAGMIYASYATYIDPSSFTVMESIFLVIILIVGGLGSVNGALAAALCASVLPEVLRFLNISVEHAAEYRQILLGILFVVVLIFRPRGLFGSYSIK